MSARPSIYVVGAGRVGTALATLLSRAGERVLGCWTRRREAAEAAEATSGVVGHHGALPDVIAGARTILITVGDPAVSTVAGALLDGGLLRQATVVLHCGGAHPAASALAPLTSVVATGTMHPLVAVARPEQALRVIPGAFFALEGDPTARTEARRLTQALGARSFELDSAEMALYHAAAVMASNHAVALWHAAETLLQRSGVDPDVAGPALHALISSTLENVVQLGVPEALTGPVRRADLPTIKRHLDVLGRRAPELEGVYRACSAVAVEAARQTSDGAALAPALRQLLEALSGPGSER